MKLLMVSAFCLFFGLLGRAQTPHGKQTTQSEVPEITLQFKPVSEGLPVSADNAFLGRPFCSPDGTTYLRAALPPDSVRQEVIAVSQKGAVSRYSLNAIQGLTGVTPWFIDAEGSHVYALVSAAKSDVLRNHDINPDSSEARQYGKYFILRFKGALIAPDEIQLDLPFRPLRFAATSKDKFVILGIEQTNQTPVLAVVDDEGQLDHYIDAYHDFGSDASLAAGAPQYVKSAKMRGAYPSENEEGDLEGALIAAHFVHYRDSLLLLLPGSKAKVFTIRSGGAIASTALHLPAGLEADTLIPSNRNWYVRASNGTSKGKEHIVVVDPTSGKVLQTIRSSQLPAYLITCVHDGNYYGIHWAGKNGNEKMFLMEAAQ